LENKLENILFINTGGGIGDALLCLPIFKYINKNLLPKNIFYYSADLENFWFEDKLKEYKPNNLITVKSFPIQFGFKSEHSTYSKNLIKNFDFDYFDLIIDNQTRVKNTLIYKKIPHKYFISPSFNFLFSRPFIFKKKDKNLISRLIDYLNKILKIQDLPNYNIEIPSIYHEKAKELMTENKKYVGFSITAGHPTRVREFKIEEIIKTANHFSKNFIPTFFIEDKYMEIKNLIKKETQNSFFPEELLSKEFKKPMIVTALGNFTEFNITIENGISHMLSFSKSKNYKFCNDSAYKFKPLNNNTVIYNCEKNNKNINKLMSNEIIDFINKN
tara:strand:+ start:107 stop:1096 length:990 start_codon:yes stop_codon:yes gene_type:complete